MLLGRQGPVLEKSSHFLTTAISIAHMSTLEHVFSDSAVVLLAGPWPVGKALGHLGLLILPHRVDNQVHYPWRCSIWWSFCIFSLKKSSPQSDVMQSSSMLRLKPHTNPTPHLGILFQTQLVGVNPHLGIYASWVKCTVETMLSDMVTSTTCSYSLYMCILLYGLEMGCCVFILLWLATRSTCLRGLAGPKECSLYWMIQSTCLFGAMWL